MQPEKQSQRMGVDVLGDFMQISKPQATKPKVLTSGLNPGPKKSKGLHFRSIVSYFWTNFLSLNLLFV